MQSTKFIYDSTNSNADLYYATYFTAPDPFMYFETRGKKFLVLSDLEIDRAKKEAKVDKVLSLSFYTKRAEEKRKKATLVDVISEVFSDYKIKKLIVPKQTSFDLVDALRQRRYHVEAGASPFYPDRLQKTSREVEYIETTQRIVFQAMKLAEDTLKKSVICGDKIFFKGSALTSEMLRKMIQIFLLERGCFASDTIVACGQHSIDPHDFGSGFLRPHQAIIVDIFPKSEKTLFYGDATRTFCKGKAPDALRKVYHTVMEGQKLGLSMIRSGKNARFIHEAILKYFKDHGYETGDKGGRKQGFFHSTGHGIGLELHEEPARIGPRDFTLKVGHVLSVEPGLYYTGIGGVRLEDLVYVDKKGCRVLGHYPKSLEIR